MIALLCASATAVAYLLCANPGFYWLDSSELVAASAGLGIAHPPGHPLAVLLGRLFVYLPWGTIGFRVALASAFCAALASGIVASITRRWIEELPEARSSRWIAPWSALAAGLTAGLSYALFFQAVRAEVYALNTALIAACAWAILRWKSTADRRYLLGAGLTAGLGLCNHHLLLLLAATPALAFVAVSALRRRPDVGRRGWALFVVAVFLGLAPLGYLPLRAAHAPRANWGAPTTLSRFAWLVSARAFQQSVDRAARESLGGRARGAGFALLAGLTPVGGLLALAGFYFALRRRETRAGAALLGGIVAFNLLSPLLVGFDPFNPDAHGYLSVAVVMLAPAIGLATFVLASALAAQRSALQWIALAAGAFPLHQLWANWQKVDLRRHFAAEEMGRALLDRAPRAVIFTAYYQSLFQAWALQQSAGVRPDVTVVHQTFLLQPGYVETMSRRHPDLAPLLRRAKRARRLLRADLEQLAASRPVYLEPDEMVPRDLGSALQPDGLLLRWGPPDARDARRHWRRIEAWQRALAADNDHETRRAVLYAHYRLAAWACAAGRTTLARAHIDRAQRLVPRSRELQDLARRCLP